MAQMSSEMSAQRIELGEAQLRVRELEEQLGRMGQDLTDARELECALREEVVEAEREREETGEALRKAVEMCERDVGQLKERVDVGEVERLVAKNEEDRRHMETLRTTMQRLSDAHAREVQSLKNEAQARQETLGSELKAVRERMEGREKEWETERGRLVDETETMRRRVREAEEALEKMQREMAVEQRKANAAEETVAQVEKARTREMALMEVARERSVRATRKGMQAEVERLRECVRVERVRASEAEAQVRRDTRDKDEDGEKKQTNTEMLARCRTALGRCQGQLVESERLRRVEVTELERRLDEQLAIIERQRQELQEREE